MNFVHPAETLSGDEFVEVERQGGVVVYASGAAGRAFDVDEHLFKAVGAHGDSRLDGAAGIIAQLLDLGRCEGDDKPLDGAAEESLGGGVIGLLAGPF